MEQFVSRYFLACPLQQQRIFLPDPGLDFVPRGQKLHLCPIGMDPSFGKAGRCPGMAGQNAALVAAGFDAVGFSDRGHRIGPGPDHMGRIPHRHMAGDAIRCIFDAVFHQRPVEGVPECRNRFKTVAGHLLFILMTTGAQLDDLVLASAAPHPMGKMGIKPLGPSLIRVASLTSHQGFQAQCLAFAPSTGIGVVGPVSMAIGAGGKIPGKRLRCIRPLAMNTLPELFDHVFMGKILIGRGFLDVALGGAVDLLYVFMGYFIQLHMTALAPQFSMDGVGDQLIVDIVDALVPVFVISPQAGVTMTDETILLVGCGL